MNFFGHAVVARWHTDSPRAHFGAMLPDFTGMVGGGAPRVSEPAVVLGVAHHHATDEVFHRTEVFRRLSGTAARHLHGRGLRRGSALAVGHVGVELLIDCVLGHDPSACDGYLAALRLAASERFRESVTWVISDEQQRFDRLIQVLLDRGLAVTDPTPERLARRMQHILAKRPRLALREGDCAVVEVWARDALDTVSGAVSALLQELHAGLDSLGWAAGVAEAAQ